MSPIKAIAEKVNSMSSFARMAFAGIAFVFWLGFWFARLQGLENNQDAIKSVLEKDVAQTQALDIRVSVNEERFKIIMRYLEEIKSDTEKNRKR